LSDEVNNIMIINVIKLDMSFGLEPASVFPVSLLEISVPDQDFLPPQAPLQLAPVPDLQTSALKKCF